MYKRFFIWLPLENRAQIRAVLFLGSRAPAVCRRRLTLLFARDRRWLTTRRDNRSFYALGAGRRQHLDMATLSLTVICINQRFTVDKEEVTHMTYEVSTINISTVEVNTRSEE
ncbi:hypothetical protein EVAR_5309_1 [Eumeta japonica]|uniref:Uncharacterized protein n=1 Tax=Eumeta variegata TaxID=151549 RepID=A0A4C1TNY8_EUMVA|nr:hypothetical protein EVAR_5309_1 [Eumeta japonica]